MIQHILSVPRYTLAAARDHYSLCKPRGTALAMFTALAEMLIATPDLQPLLPPLS
jgi:hypothetical protein